MNKKYKVKDLVLAKPTFEKIVTQDLPVAVAFRLHGLVDGINPHLTRFFKVRAEVQAKHQIGLHKDPVEAQAAMDAATMELGAVLEEEVEVYTPPITVEDLSSARISVQDVLALKKFLA